MPYKIEFPFNFEFQQPTSNLKLKFRWISCIYSYENWHLHTLPFDPRFHSWIYSNYVTFHAKKKKCYACLCYDLSKRRRRLVPSPLEFHADVHWCQKLSIIRVGHWLGPLLAQGVFCLSCLIILPLLSFLSPLYSFSYPFSLSFILSTLQPDLVVY